MNKFNFKSYDNSYQSVSYCEVDKCKAVIELRNQLDQLKAENEELKKCYKNNSALLDFEETNTTKLVNKVMKLEKTLTEIKEIAETISQPMGTGKSCNRVILAKQILQKISECEVTNG